MGMERGAGGAEDGCMLWRVRAYLRVPSESGWGVVLVWETERKLQADNTVLQAAQREAREQRERPSSMHEMVLAWAQGTSTQRASPSCGAWAEKARRAIHGEGIVEDEWAM